MGMVMLQRHLWATLPTLHFPFNPAGALPVTCANGKTPNITAVVHFKGHQSVGHSQFQPVLSLSFWVGAGQVMEKSRSNLRVTGKCPLTLGMFCSSRFELRYRLLPTEYTHVVSDHKEGILYTWRTTFIGHPSTCKSAWIETWTLTILLS